MSANLQELARKACRDVGKTLHNLLYKVVPFPTMASRKPPETAGELFYSKTISHADEIKPSMESFAQQIATAIKTNYKAGVLFYENSFPALNDRFPGGITYRFQIMGVALAVAVKKVGNDKAQITVLVTVDKWQP